jgi:hypothetical protein
MPVILATQEAEGGLWFEASPRQIVHETLSQKHSIQNRAGGVAQVVECLTSKCKALSSNSSTAKLVLLEDTSSAPP